MCVCGGGNTVHNLINEKAEKLCKGKETGRSFQTDGTQAVLQYIELKTITLRGSSEKAEKRKETDEARMIKLIEWRNEGKEQGKGRPRFPTLKESREISSKKPFIGEKRPIPLEILQNLSQK